MDNRISRTSVLIHQGTGTIINTPLLVPSFSSKGLKIQGGDTSEVTKIFDLTAEYITESYLISAYDIKNNYIPGPAALPFKPKVIILDSGGYEVSTDRDLSDVINPNPGKHEWNVENLKTILDAWPKEYASILVSYDHPDEHRSFEEQISRARELFKGRQDHLCTFLLKPESKLQYTLDVVIKQAIVNISELRSFDIIGLTQKELGHSILDQMAQIARLRNALDESSIKAPIHIFGSLDPLTVCLFFIAGAEIFDGLTWMKYAYRESQCVYFDNAAVLDMGLNFHHNRVRAQFMRNNIVELEKLAVQMRDFQFHNDFSKLPHSLTMQKAFDSLRTHLGKGGA
jgi:hypothetical protein